MHGLTARSKIVARAHFDSVLLRQGTPSRELAPPKRRHAAHLLSQVAIRLRKDIAMNVTMMNARAAGKTVVLPSSQLTPRLSHRPRSIVVRADPVDDLKQKTKVRSLPRRCRRGCGPALHASELSNSEGGVKLSATRLSRRKRAVLTPHLQS